MSIIVRGTMRVVTRPVIWNTRLSEMTIEISHEHYDQWNKVYFGGDWKSRTELLEYCLYVGLAQLEKRMKENKKLEEYNEEENQIKCPWSDAIVWCNRHEREDKDGIDCASCPIILGNVRE